MYRWLTMLFLYQNMSLNRSYFHGYSNEDTSQRYQSIKTNRVQSNFSKCY